VGGHQRHQQRQHEEAGGGGQRGRDAMGSRSCDPSPAAPPASKTVKGMRTHG
jgi:hypothetical protein